MSYNNRPEGEVIFMKKTTSSYGKDVIRQMAEAQNAGAPTTQKPLSSYCEQSINCSRINEMAEAQNAGARRDYSRYSLPH